MPSKKFLGFSSGLLFLCAAGCRSKPSSPAAGREAASPASVDASRPMHYARDKRLLIEHSARPRAGARMPA